MRVTVSDVVSPSYFPLTAAVEPDVARGYTFPALVARDAPFFDPTVSPDAIDGACRFAQSIGQHTSRSSPPSSSTCGQQRVEFRNAESV
jgi:hypothetical protein